MDHWLKFQPFVTVHAALANMHFQKATTNWTQADTNLLFIKWCVDQRAVKLCIPARRNTKWIVSGHRGNSFHTSQWIGLADRSNPKKQVHMTRILETTSLTSSIVVWGTSENGIMGQNCYNLFQIKQTMLFGGLSSNRVAETLYKDKNGSTVHRQPCSTANSELVK